MLNVVKKGALVRVDSEMRPISPNKCLRQKKKLLQCRLTFGEAGIAQLVEQLTCNQ